MSSIAHLGELVSRSPQSTRQHSRKIKSVDVLAILWACITVLMATSTEYRFVAILIFCVVCIISFLQFKNMRSRAYVNAFYALFALKLIFLFSSIIKLIIYNLEISAVIYFFLAPIVIASLAITLSKDTYLVFLQRYCHAILCLAIIIAILHFIGVRFLVSDNYIAALFAIAMIYHAIKRNIQFTGILLS
ncbi:hypothetical protein [Glycocaulis sp.]|uniref:hypothetical protein n=1 Tax=Glycocaulis sp. TaxID=1969725 RepID=UPI003F6F74D7